MKNLVRGGVVSLITSMFVAVVFAQTSKPENALAVGQGSLYNIENAVSEVLYTSNNSQFISDDDIKKLVKTTGSSRAVGAGASRGAFSATASGASRGAFSATAYCLKGRTAMGHGVRRGIIAADPRVLKLGSTVTLGGAYAGRYLVSDTGGRIKGKKIDIWVPSCSEARKFGRRNVQVFAN